MSRWLRLLRLLLVVGLRLVLPTLTLLLVGRTSAPEVPLVLFSFLLFLVFLHSQRLGNMLLLLLVANSSTLVASFCKPLCGDVQTVLADTRTSFCLSARRPERCYVQDHTSPHLGLPRQRVAARLYEPSACNPFSHPWNALARYQEFPAPPISNRMSPTTS